MVIFTARQNLANLNEVKINLIVKFCEFGREILYMNLEENFSMCFKHLLKHIICSIVLRYFKHFVLTEEYKYAYVKCMLN